MPKYLIFDAEAFERAALLETNSVDGIEAAIQSVPSTTSLPARCVLVKRTAVDEVIVAGPSDDEPTVVQRAAG